MVGMRGKLMLAVLLALILFPCLFCTHTYAQVLYCDSIREDSLGVCDDGVSMDEDDIIFHLNYLAGSADENVLLGEDSKAKPDRVAIDRMLNLLKAQPNSLQAVAHLLSYAQGDRTQERRIFDEMEKIVQADARQVFAAVLLAEHAMSRKDLKKSLSLFKRASVSLLLSDEPFIRQTYRGTTTDKAFFESVLAGGYICAIVRGDADFKAQIEDFLSSTAKILPLRAYAAMLRTMGTYARAVSPEMAVKGLSPEGKAVWSCMPAVVECYFQALERATEEEARNLNDATFAEVVFCAMHSRLPYYLHVLVEKHPGEDLPYLALADVYAFQNHHEEAYRTMKKYFSFFSRRAGFEEWGNLAKFSFASGHLVDGLSAAMHAMNLADVAGDEAYSQGLALLVCMEAFEKGFCSEALAFAERVRVKNRHTALMKALAFCAAQKLDRAFQVVRENKDLILSNFSAQESLTPGAWGIYMAFFNLAISNHDVELAERFFEIGVRSKPKDSELYNDIAYCYACENVKLDLAERYASQALSLAPESTAILDTLAWVYFRRGKFDLAETVMRRCCERMKQGGEPMHSVNYYHVAEIAFALKKYAVAKENWQKALDAFSPEVDEFTRGELQKKLTDVEKLLEKMKGVKHVS